MRLLRELRVCLPVCERIRTATARISAVGSEGERFIVQVMDVGSRRVSNIAAQMPSVDASGFALGSQIGRGQVCRCMPGRSTVGRAVFGRRLSDVDRSEMGISACAGAPGCLRLRSTIG